MKLAIYPRKISNRTSLLSSEYNSNSNINLKNNQKQMKLNRVLSLSKDVFKTMTENYKDKSYLNRGIIYNSRLRLNSQMSLNSKLLSENIMS